MKNKTGPKGGPHKHTQLMINHPFVVEFDNIPKKCTCQLTRWDKGTSLTETNEGLQMWFYCLVKFVEHILRNKDRIAVIAHRHDPKTRTYAIFVNDVSITEEEYEKILQRKSSIKYKKGRNR